MRRCLHSLLVGVLTFSLSVDAARACGHLRFRRCAPAPCSIPTVVVVGCGCGETVLPSVVFAGCEEIACGTPLDCCGGAEAAVVPSTRAPAATESVVTPAPPVTTAEPVPSEPTPAPVVSVVPDLEPVSPASATEPATEPKTPTEESGSAPEGGMAAGDAAPQPGDEAEPAGEKPRGEDEPTDAAVAEVEHEPAEPAADTDAEMADGNAVTEEEPSSVPDAPEPPDVPEPPVPPQPEPNPFDEPDSAATEPHRRWIDDTASYAVVGRLVGVHGDAVEILRADGRLVQVPLGRLSGFDRDYVADAGPRIASARPRGPRATDTASR